MTMKTLTRWSFVITLAFLAATGMAPAQNGHLLLVSVHDTLQPVRARSFAHEMSAASHPDIKGVLITLSTPGGMESATDTMVNAIRRCPVPVVVWIDSAPSRVSGQGLRIVAEADVVMMAPGTYLTPLWTDPPRNLSAEQRSAGTRRLLASLTDAAARHGRHPYGLDALTSGAHWFSAAEAQKAGLSDGVAEHLPDIPRLLKEQTVTHHGQQFQLDLKELGISAVSITSKDLLLLALMNPNLDVLLLTLGLLLIYLEINTPGIVVPGAAGILLVLLAAFSISSLPINPLGVALCVAGLCLMVLESRFQTRGILAACGVLGLTLGLGNLVVGPIPQLQVGWPTALGAGIGFGGITATLVSLAAVAKREKVKTGSDAMLGWLAVAHTPLAPSGKILVRGELWNARLTTHDSTVAEGGHVKVLRADGMTLEVTAIPLTQSS